MKTTNELFFFLLGVSVGVVAALLTRLHRFDAE